MIQDIALELKADLAIDVPSELYEVYCEEAEGHIAQIYSSLDALKTKPDDRSELQSLRRSAHTLKSAASAVGVRVVAKLSHRMEDLLDWLYDHKEPLSQEHLTLLLDTTDRLHDLSFGEFDKNELADRLASIYARYAEELAAANDGNTDTNELPTLIGDFDSLPARPIRLARFAQDRLMNERMVSVAVWATRLHRAVRMIAAKQNKQVELIVEDGETKIDSTVAKEIADPLLHLIRNAVDHGVEPTDLRVKKGKPVLATIRLRAFYHGTQVVVQLSDDGGGLDPWQIANAAVRKGYLKEAKVTNMTPQEIFRFIFLPGVSTASEVSEFSGRGVGMDIVRDKVQKLNGEISIVSEKDTGTTFTIRLPVPSDTLSDDASQQHLTGSR